MAPTEQSIPTDRLQQGLALHQAGRLAEARTCYEEALRRQPGNSSALHLLGLVAVGQGRLDEGIALYRSCLRSQPDFAIAWTNLGNVLLMTGQPAEAVEALQQAVALAPGLAEAHCNLGIALQALGRLEESAGALAQAVALKPELAEAHNNLGNVHKALGRGDLAEAAYRAALQTRPAYADAWYNLGNLLLALGRPAEAEEAYARAVTLQPRRAEVHTNRAQALKELGRLAEAQAACRTAIQLRPDGAEAHTNLGNILERERRWEEAAVAHRRALALRPDLVEAWSNLGNSLLALGRSAEALDAYREARRLQPGSAEIAYNEALVLLQRGEFRAGWEGYEARWGMPGARRRPVQVGPAWDGRAPLAGRSIVVYAEQGLGDTLQFARYLPLLAARGARVHAVVQKPLKSLLTRLPGVHAVTTADGDWPACDYHCPLLSLPRAFGTEPATIPAQIPYVTARPDKAEEACGWLPAGTRLRVGAVWSGNPAHRNDHNRSLPLEALASALTAATPGWVSLQPKLREGEAAQLRAAGASDLSARLQDFEDTAGVLAHLDLVITVDTSVAHLAGAMGRPTWVLLPYAADWRWLEDREDSPWYPTVRLFRQKRPGDWTAVLACLASELARLG